MLLSSHADVMTLAGGTVVGNIVGAGTTNTLNFALGSGVIYTDSNTFTTINQVNINSGTVLLDDTTRRPISMCSPARHWAAPARSIRF